MEEIKQEVAAEVAQVENVVNQVEAESKEDVQKELELEKSCTPAVIGSVLIVLVLEIIAWWVL